MQTRLPVYHTITALSGLARVLQGPICLPVDRLLVLKQGTMVANLLTCYAGVHDRPVWFWLGRVSEGGLST
jgi:hypothetical protein